MKTRRSDEQVRHGLPPPPAPTASDANPWQMSAPAGGTKHAPRHPRAPGQRARPRSNSRLWIPLLVVFAIVGSGVQAAIRALWEGEVETAIGALVIVVVMAVVALRRILKRRSD